MADRQLALQVIDKLKESGVTDDQIKERLSPLSPEARDQEYDKLATRFGLKQQQITPTNTSFEQPDTVQGPPKPSQEEMEKAALLKQGRQVNKERGAGTVAALGRGFLDTQLIGQSEEAIAAARSATSPRNFEALNQEEEAATAAFKEDNPIAFPVGQVLGFVGPGGVATILRKAGAKSAALTARATGQLAEIGAKLFPKIVNKSILEAMGKAFVIGATELGLFEGTKELLETGDVKKSLKVGAKSAVQGGVGGAVVGGTVQKLLGGETVTIAQSKVEDAIEIGLKKQAADKALQEAAKQGKKTEALAKKILNTDDPNVIGPLMKNPERVKELVESGGTSAFDIGKKMLRQFEGLKDRLTTSVHKLKRAVNKDTTTLIEVGLSKKALSGTEKALTNTQGTSLLIGDAAEKYDTIKKLLYEDKIPASDALKAVESIDAFVNYAKREGNNLSEAASKGLKLARAALKSRLHKSYPKWATADAHLHNFLTLAEDITKSITDNPERFVNGIFGKNKTQIQKDLVRLTGLARRLDPSVRFETGEIARTIVASRAAEGVQAAINPLRRTTQEVSNEITRKYERYGGRAGAGLSALIGSLVGGPTTTMVGAATGNAVGGAIGNKIGQAIGNPMRVLNAAIKSKALSQSAKAIAKDLRNVALYGSPEDFARVIDLIPAAAKGAKEFAEFLVNNTTIKSTDLYNDEELAPTRTKQKVGGLVESSLAEVNQ